MSSILFWTALFMAVGGLFTIAFDPDKALVLLATAWVIHLIGIALDYSKDEDYE